MVVQYMQNCHNNNNNNNHKEVGFVLVISHVNEEQKGV
jgi:hypothetical protein